jgi:hypothetical protein
MRSVRERLAQVIPQELGLLRVYQVKMDFEGAEYEKTKTSPSSTSSPRTGTDMSATDISEET